MRLKLLVPLLAVSTLGVAACGGGSSSSAGPSKTGSPSATHGRPARVYRLALAGGNETPRGAPKGTGTAVIAIHGRSVVCWRFAHLHGFANATFAHIHIGAKGKSGNIVVPLSTGSRLHHRGCVSVSPALIKAIERRPHSYYVNIHSTAYPGGAVRAQL